MQSSGINNTSECCLIIYGGKGVKKRRLEAEMAESKKQRKTGRGRGWGRGAAVTSCITHKTAISVTYESVEACRKKEKAASTFQKSSKNNYKQYESTLDLLSIMKLPIMLKAILHFPFRNEPLWFNFLFTLTSLVYFRFLLLQERLPTITGVQMLRSSTPPAPHVGVESTCASIVESKRARVFPLEEKSDIWPLRSRCNETWLRCIIVLSELLVSVSHDGAAC